MQGGLSQAMRRDLGEDVWQDLRSQVQTAVSAIEPETPILINLDASLGPQILPNAPEQPDGTTNYQIIAATPARPGTDDLDPSAATSAIIKLATDNNITQLAIPLLGSGRAGLDSVSTVKAMLKATYWAIPEADNPLKQVTLTTRQDIGDEQSEIVAAAQRTIDMLTANRAQKLSADSPSGEDTLGIEKEVFALAETLLLRDVETPLAVGVLGGWGSGKSFVMHLMLKEMLRIRSLKVTKGWADNAGPAGAYVGHVYPIEFNAWTYAKSDLWASLMQTIFMELNKQLTMERLIGNELLLAGCYWLELSQLGEKEREALQSKVGQEAIKAAIEKWQQGDAPDSLWDAYDKVRSTETVAMRNAVAQRKDKQAALENLAHTLEREKIEVIPRQARQQVWQEIITTAVFSTVAQEIQDDLKEKTYLDENNEEQPVFTEQDLEDLGKLNVKLKQFRPTVTDMLQEQTIKGWFQEQKGLLIMAGILVLVAIFVPILSSAVDWLAQSATMASITTFFASISSVGMALYRTYQPWLDKIQRWNDGISSVINMADEMLTTKEQQIAIKREADLETRKQDLKTEITGLNQQINQHRQRLGIAGEFTSLYDFVSSRLTEGDYEERLGMLHQTQSDLQELTNTLMVHGEKDLFADKKKEFFPRGPARVVLFVDDLDRCPPDKVVEVLEAIQLLLRTKLFVVVLGLDTRYVTRALEKEYSDILTHLGDPSGLDYIEKIIQIPYRVRPIEPGKLHGFLEAQMEMVSDPPPLGHQQEEEGGEETLGIEPISTTEIEDQVHSTGKEESLDHTPPPSNLPKSNILNDEPESSEPEIEAISPQKIKFHPEDFVDLEHSCVSLGLTPRSIKRLINVLKLIKVFWFRTNQNKKQYEIRTVINLLTLSARHPEIMAQVFHSIEMAYREDKKTQKKLSDFLVFDTENGELIRLAQQDMFETAVSSLNLADITLAQFGLETFHLVRSFSFVGDPVYTAD